MAFNFGGLQNAQLAFVFTLETPSSDGTYKIVEVILLAELVRCFLSVLGLRAKSVHFGCINSSEISSPVGIPTYGCFYKLGAHFLRGPLIRAIVLGVYIRALDFANSPSTSNSKATAIVTPKKAPNFAHHAYSLQLGFRMAI